MAKLTLNGKYETSMGAFNFSLTVEGEDAEKLWDVIYKQTAKEKAASASTAASATAASAEEESPEVTAKVDEVLSAVKELTGS